MLTAENVDIRHGPLLAVAGACLEVRRGETLAITGPNGAGKTSLVRALARLAPVSAGRIRFRDRAIEGLDRSRLEGIAIVPEARSLAPTLSVRETLQLGGRSLARAERPRRLDDVLALLPPLVGLLERRAGTLSGGEAQLLSIARALMSRPLLLLVDEPTAGLSASALQTVRAVFRDLKAGGLTMLVCEQDCVLSDGLADRAARMEDGRLGSFVARRPEPAPGAAHDPKEETE